MNARDINRDNIGIAVEEVLSACLAQLNETRDEFVVQDLKIAIESLRRINDELNGNIASVQKACVQLCLYGTPLMPMTT